MVLLMPWATNDPSSLPQNDSMNQRKHGNEKARVQLSECLLPQKRDISAVVASKRRLPVPLAVEIGQRVDFPNQR